MPHRTISTLSVCSLLISLLSGCGGGSADIRVKEGSEQIGQAPTGSLYLTDQASIVHVDASERIATLRNARNFAAGTFLETKSSDGVKTATLKTLVSRESGLRTADILEGEPNINDQASPVSPSEMERLEKIYRDPIE